MSKKKNEIYGIYYLSKHPKHMVINGLKKVVLLKK